MKQWICAILFSLLPALTFAGVSGNWTTIDDTTGKKRAVVHINASGDNLSGTIVKVYAQPGDTGICSKCPGKFKGKKIQGLQILWGLKKKSDNEWTGGQILDPKSGKVYSAKVTLENDKTLRVRGYMGVSMLGRTQTWVR